MQDAPFMQAVETVLAHEGGFADDPADPGGATNWGVSLRFLLAQGALDGPAEYDFDGDGDVDAEDVRAMTRADAIEIYRRHFWDKYDYGRLPSGIGAKVFDLAITMGGAQAHRLLQRACRACGEHVDADGILGPVTRAAIEWYE